MTVRVCRRLRPRRTLRERSETHRVCRVRFSLRLRDSVWSTMLPERESGGVSPICAASPYTPMIVVAQ